jgi:TIR domain
MFDVFISYGHQDKLVADAACARLEGRGIRCWIAPRDLLPGQPYAEGITVALRSCRALVLIFSANANLSRHVNNEVERAVNNNIPIVPFRIEDVRPTGALEYFIGPVHWLDALTKPLDQHLERLADDLHLLIGAREAPRAAAAVPQTPPPARMPAQWRLYAFLVLGVVLIAFVIGWFLIDSQRSSPSVAVNPIQPSQPASAKRVEAPPQRALRPTAEKKVPVRTAATTAPEGLAGCWLYNNVLIKMDSAGRVMAPIAGAHWSSEGGNRYAISWPDFVDTITLSADGQSLAGSDNYGPVISAQRISGAQQGFAGVWLWSDGLTVTVSEDGSIADGISRGKWHSVGGEAYRIEWANFPVDQLAMSSDAQTLSGRNQFGNTVGGRRVPCSN